MSILEANRNQFHSRPLSGHLHHRLATLVIVTAKLSLGICHVYAANVEEKQRTPNIVLILVDDQGYGDLGCHGNPVVKTPRLDKLHSESVRLTDFHVAPMCTPTRGQLLSGRDALRNGAMNVSSGRTPLRTEFPTMADAFAAAGYRCGHFGKWHLGDNYPYRPHDRGFHEAVYFASSHIGSAPDPWNNDYFDDIYWHNGLRKPYEGYTTDVFFHEAERFIAESDEAGKPFFVYIPLAAAHGPLFVPAKYREPYAATQPHNIASFFGMIANIDENVGRLDDLLTERGLRDDTILIFMTDNGGTAGVPVYNAGMRGRKIELYDGGHRVPCFIRWPAGKLGEPRDVDVLTECQDVLPTLVELCDLPMRGEAAFDGVSLAGLLRGTQTSLADRMLCIQFSRMNAPVPTAGDACVLWNKWRLVNDKELYDIADDPGQQKDVAAAHPDVVRQMRDHYAAWWSGVAPRVNEPAYVVVGGEHESPTHLSAADWYDVFIDQQRQVRAGDRKTGPWHVEVAAAGDYEITLSRWPLEADLPMAAPAPPHQGPDGTYAAGVALPVVRGRLKVGEFDETKPVSATDKSLTFEVPLAAGRTQLQTWLTDADGQTLCGAYYVQVRRK